MTEQESKIRKIMEEEGVSRLVAIIYLTADSGGDVIFEDEGEKK